jgi:hypothetical protein
VQQPVGEVGVVAGPLTADADVLAAGPASLAGAADASRDRAGASQLEETCCYRLRDPENGWAVQRVYSSERDVDLIQTVQDGDLLLIRWSHHTTVAAHGHDLSYLVGDARETITELLGGGCTTILEPASETPLMALALAALMEEAGLPAGVVNVLPSEQSGKIVSATLADSRVRKPCFTGSTEVGRTLLNEASNHIVNCSMELGGHTPLLVQDVAGGATVQLDGQAPEGSGFVYPPTVLTKVAGDAEIQGTEIFRSRRTLRRRHRTWPRPRRVASRAPGLYRQHVHRRRLVMQTRTADIRAPRPRAWQLTEGRPNQ